MVQKEKNKGGKNSEKLTRKIYYARILELLIIIATIMVINWIAIKYATAVRGYEAVGGEYLYSIIRFSNHND